MQSPIMEAGGTTPVQIGECGSTLYSIYIILIDYVISVCAVFSMESTILVRSTNMALTGGTLLTP